MKIHEYFYTIRVEDDEIENNKRCCDVANKKGEKSIYFVFSFFYFFYCWEMDETVEWRDK